MTIPKPSKKVRTAFMIVGILLVIIALALGVNKYLSSRNSKQTKQVTQNSKENIVSVTDSLQNNVNAAKSSSEKASDLLYLGANQMYRKEYKAAKSSLEQVLALSEASAKDKHLAKASLITVYANLGDFDSAIKTAEDYKAEIPADGATPDTQKTELTTIDATITQLQQHKIPVVDDGAHGT